MKNQVKVSTTQKYSDSQGEHIVCEGKLMFLTEQSPLWEEGALFREVECERVFRGTSKNQGVQRNSTFERIKPIIISETEEITKEDIITDGEDLFEWDSELDRFLKIYSNEISKGLRTYVEFLEAKETAFYKVLALPECFSDKHLQAIVDGKMKDGDEVLIKYDKGGYRSPIHMDSGADPDPEGIHLNQQNHITLFPAQQSLEEAAEEYATANFELDPVGSTYTDLVKAFTAGWEARTNYKGEPL